MSAAANSATESAPARNWAHYTDPEWIDVDGLATAYRREGSGEPLLFLNGERGTRSWLPVCEELAKSFDVILPEHPGFGDTEMPEWLSGFDDLVLHYDALLRALGLEKVHLVGHSVGAWIAADLGVFYPERFASLSLVTPTGVRLPDEVRVADVFRLGEDAPDVLFNGRGEEFAEFFEQEGGIDDKVQAYSELVT
ncbi:MAG TPA: alpha/beta fold hydrolase, partial [Acidimicrobiales bacterium]|nr:alpha/beta fold hydrolase [Acidimicrobiales bacterium]